MENKELIQQLLDIPAETNTVEFKRFGSKNESIDRTLQSIVAFANTDGGLLVFGIDDPEKTNKKGYDRIYGIEENLELYDALARELKTIVPPIGDIWPPTLITVPGKNARVGLLYIPKATESFRSINGHVWVRGEKGNRRLTPQEIIQFSYIKGFQKADRELVDVSMDLLETSDYQAWRQSRGIKLDRIEDILKKTGLAREDTDGKLKPTRAAVLLFAEFPSDLLDTKCTIKVLIYSGKTEQIDETINLLDKQYFIHGSAIRQIQEAHKYVLNLLRSGIRVPSGFVTNYQIPERAIKEAITNAVIHRDYHTKRDIIVRVFEDRVEVESPGLLPFNISPSNIGHVRAFNYRNDLLVKHLREFPEPPNLDENEGVKAMRQAMERGKLYPPTFITYPELPDSVRVVLLNKEAPSEWQKVSDYLEKNQYITNREAREILKLETYKISRFFTKWLKQGLLAKANSSDTSRKGSKYRLSSSEEKNLFAGAGANKN